MSHDVEIITYGGGDLLRMIFNAIAMLFYGDSENSSFVRPLCLISSTIGCSWAISRCFFQAYVDQFLTKFFLPLLAIPSLLLVPQTSIHIIDKLDNKAIKVDHVPFLFAKVAGLTNYWSVELTQAIENVMHTPNDAKYLKTGMIFGADTALDFSRLKINNATLSQNLHHFTQQCIIYDVALGRYSLDQLRKTSDLINFLKEKTSKVRMIPYTDPNSGKSEFVSCINSVDKMSFLLEKEADYYAKNEIFKNLPLAYQTLMTFKKESENKITNQLGKALGNVREVTKDILTVNAFDNAMNRFATERAKDNQRATYQTAGALAGSSLVSLRIVFEALIYASCVFIVPLSLIPGGVKFLGSWVFLNIWIQLWPPLYAILNYITLICAEKYFSSILRGSDGFSIFTSAGFQELALDTAAIGGYLSLSVPVLSFYLLQNIQSLVHLAPSMLTPTHSASQAAGAELSSGNYSFANTSMGQMSFENLTGFQQNSAATLSTGFFTDNYGTHQVKYGQDHITVNQDPSHLNTSISTAEAYSHSLQNAKQQAQTQVESSSQLYTETRGAAIRSAADLLQHVASSETYTSGYSNSETLATQESANWITNSAESWGTQHGMNTRESLEYFASLSAGWPIFVSAQAGHSGNSGVVSDEGRQSALNIVNSSDFQEHFQKVTNFAQSEALNSMTDEGKRFVENYAISQENLKSAQQQGSESFSLLNQISENLNYIESHSNTVSKNLNTEFANWLHEKGNLRVLFDKERSEELEFLRDQFIEEKCQMVIPTLKNFQPPNSSFTASSNIENNFSHNKENLSRQASEQGLNFGMVQEGEKIYQKYEDQKDIISNKFSEQDRFLGISQLNIKQAFETENEKLMLDRLNAKILENSKEALQKVVNTPSETWAWFDN